MHFASKTLILQTLRAQLRSYQKRIKAGDRLPTIVELSAMAGVHRDTIYALIAGEKVNERSQYAISKALREVEGKIAGQVQTKILSLNLTSTGPRLRFGFNKRNIFD